MSSPVGALGHLGLRTEYSFASGGAVNVYQPIISEDLQLVKSYSFQDRVMNTPEQVGGRFMNEHIAGSITFPVSPSNPQNWWRCGIGQTSSPYYPSRPLESLAIEVDREMAGAYTSGDMVASLELSSETGGELTCVAQIEGKGFNTSTPSAPTFTSGDDPYLHNEAVFQINGVTSTDIVSFSVSIDNNLSTGLYANQRQRRLAPATKVVVTGSFKKLFEDALTYNKFLQENVVSLQAQYSRGANSFTILLNKVRLINDNTPVAGQAEYITETFNFQAYVDDPSTERSIKITVV